MLSAKVLLLSTGVLSTGVALRVAVPAAAAFLLSDVPRIYDAALTWLTPPYLYFVINLIIISIAASSRFQKPAGEECAAEGKVQVGTRREEEDPLPTAPVAFTVGSDAQLGEEQEVAQQAGLRGMVEAFGGGAEGSASDEKAVTPEDKDAAVEEEFVISRSSWTPRKRDPPEVPPAVEKPLVSVRFASRRGIKASPEGRALGVAKPKKSETLENTWKAITDGRAMPLTRHLRKSDTWGADGGRPREQAAAAAEQKTPVGKSETFKERRVQAADSSPSPGGSHSGRLRRDASLGQDELNRRVEAFIRKFNEEMRLQRQESFKHYMEIIKPDGH